MRIAIGGFMHESNTFAGDVTGVERFVEGGLERGEAIRERWGDAHHEVGGFFKGEADLGFEAVPTLMGWATPAGPVTNAAYEQILGELLDRLGNAAPFDAVLIALHGAMVAEGIADADGETLARIRRKIGPDVPLVVTLDFHGNVSKLVTDSADAVLAYRTYPHVDQRQRGAKAAKIAFEAASGRIKPISALRKPPMLVHLLAQNTSKEPMASLIRELERLDGEILDASILAGFPYADVKDAGVSCIAVVDGNRAQAETIADRLANLVWQNRKALTASPPGPEEAVRLALAVPPELQPVVLVDIGDNIGGGSAADSTVLIREVERQGGTGAVVVLYDPEAVRICREAGQGGRVQLSAGGKVDDNATPLPVCGTVRLLHDGKYTEDAPRHGGIRFNDQGETAVIATDSGNTVVVNSLRHPPFSLGQITSLGIDPKAARILIVKAAVAFRAAYEPVAGTIIEADTPGLTAANPKRFPYKKIRRPIIPLDDAVGPEFLTS